MYTCSVGDNSTLTSISVWKGYCPLQDKLAEAQRKELDLNDQLQLYRDQLEATKVLHCSSGKNSVCSHHIGSNSYECSIFLLTGGVYECTACI